MIKIYTKPNCPYCTKAKEYLQGIHIEFTAIDITKNPMAHSFMIGNGHKTVPQIYCGDTVIEGGYDGLIRYTREDINSLIGDTNVNQYGIEL